MCLIVPKPLRDLFRSTPDQVIQNGVIGRRNESEAVDKKFRLVARIVVAVAVIFLLIATNNSAFCFATGFVFACMSPPTYMISIGIGLVKTGIDFVVISVAQQVFPLCLIGIGSIGCGYWCFEKYDTIEQMLCN